MGLYDRDYIKSKANTNISSLPAERITFLKQTYQLLALSMVSAALGAYLALPFATVIMKFKWLIFGLEMLILFFGLGMSRGKPGLNLFMLFLFTFVTGVSLVPILAMLIGAGKAGVIGNAFLATSILFGALSIFAINTKTDFSSWGKPLFITMIVIMVVSIINIFLGSGILAVIINAAVLLLFGIFTIYDTQNIINGEYDSPVDAALSLYLDFFNMFVVILQFLGIMDD
jgi:modulator of FtsH protease